MGGILSFFAAQCACEAATCCAGLGARCCCAASRGALGTNTVTRVGYLTIFLTTSLVAWILSNWADVIIPFFPVLQEVPVDLFGPSSVYRVTAALAVFHLVFSAALIGIKSDKDPRSMIHNGGWLLKAVLLIGLIISFFFIPNEVLGTIGTIALIGSFMFIFVQLVILIDFAYTWNATWLGYLETTGSESWFYMLVAAMVLMYAFSASVTIAMVVLFAGGEGCGLNALAVTINLIACTVLSISSVTTTVQAANPESGLLQSAVVTSYACYLVFSAAMSGSSDNAASCGSVTGGSAATHTSLVVGAFFTIVAVCYSALRVSMSSDSLRMLRSSEPIYSEVAVDDEGREPSVSEGDDPDHARGLPSAKKEEAEGVDVTYSYSFFHFTFALAALYMCMLLSKWQVLGMGTDETGLTVDRGEGAWWVKIISSWLVLGLYAWTLWAPVIMPDREFAFSV